MPKVYTDDFKTGVEEKKQVKQETLNNILSFSKSLEVIKIDSKNKNRQTKNVEVILN